MVFTFRGEDVVDTILRFAHEYRVGHVVIGRPGPLSLWQRVRGNRSVAERLIHEARGISVVVIDAEAGERFHDAASNAATKDGSNTLMSVPGTCHRALVFNIAIRN